MPLRIVFAGTPEFAVPCLRAAAQRNEVVAVYTQPDRPAGRGRELALSPVKREALLRGLPVLQPDNFKTGAVEGRAARAQARPAGGGRLRPDPAAVGARHPDPRLLERARLAAAALARRRADPARDPGRRQRRPACA